MSSLHDASLGPHLRRASDRVAPDRRLSSREDKQFAEVFAFETYTPLAYQENARLGIVKRRGLTALRPPLLLPRPGVIGPSSRKVSHPQVSASMAGGLVAKDPRAELPALDSQPADPLSYTEGALVKGRTHRWGF